MVSKNIDLKNGQVLVIKEARKIDVAGVLEYLNRTAGESDYLSFGPGELNISQEQEEQFIENHLNADNKLLVIAKINQEIVGSFGFAGGDRPRIRHTGEIGMAVLKKYWGLGIGTSLVETLIEWAKSSGIKKINLRVRLDNDRALRLYERFGFVREGLITKEFFIDGKFYDSIFMGLQID